MCAFCVAKWWVIFCAVCIWVTQCLCHLLMKLLKVTQDDLSILYYRYAIIFHKFIMKHFDCTILKNFQRFLVFFSNRIPIDPYKLYKTAIIQQSQSISIGSIQNQTPARASQQIYNEIDSRDLRPHKIEIVLRPYTSNILSTRKALHKVRI